MSLTLHVTIPTVPGSVSLHKRVERGGPRAHTESRVDDKGRTADVMEIILRHQGVEVRGDSTVSRQASMPVAGVRR
jgi:hypothetical protein